MRNWKRDPYAPGHLARGGKLDHVRLGLDHPRCKLTEDQVREIRESGENTQQLANKFKVSWSTVDRVRKGATWRSLK
jgi:hypothetical protein